MARLLYERCLPLRNAFRLARTIFDSSPLSERARDFFSLNRLRLLSFLIFACACCIRHIKLPRVLVYPTTGIVRSCRGAGLSYHRNRKELPRC